MFKPTTFEITASAVVRVQSYDDVPMYGHGEVTDPRPTRAVFSVKARSLNELDAEIEAGLLALVEAGELAPLGSDAYAARLTGRIGDAVRVTIRTNGARMPTEVAERSPIIYLDWPAL